MKKLLTAIAIALASMTTWAQSTVELVVPSTPGGIADKLAQVIAAGARPEFAKQGITLVIAYKPGVSTVLGANAVASTEPGKISFMVTNNATLTVPFFTPNVATYDIGKDFALINYLGYVPGVIVASPASGIKTAADWRAACAGGKLTYGSPGVGGTSHISTEMINNHFGCKALHVTYKGASNVVTDLVGGHVGYYSGFLGDTQQLIETGKLNAVMVMDQNRLPELPNVPTVYELGYKDYNFYNWFVLVANATAKPADIAQAQQIFTRAMNMPETAAKLQEAGLRGRKAQPADFLAKEKQSFAKNLQTINIKTN